MAHHFKSHEQFDRAVLDLCDFLERRFGLTETEIDAVVCVRPNETAASLEDLLYVLCGEPDWSNYN